MRTVWRCELCGADYDTRADAVACENAHCKPTGVCIDSAIGSTYPYQECDLRNYLKPAFFPDKVLVAFETERGGIVQKVYVRGDAL